MGEYHECGVVIQDFENLEKYLEANIDSFKIVYQPLQPQDEFDYVASLVYSVGDCVFIVEELDNFCSPYEFSLDFANIIQRGRHVGVDFIGVSQRPMGINRTISAQCKEILTFQQSEPRDLTYLSTYIGKDVDKVRELGQYEYLHWRMGQITIHKPDGSATDLRNDDGTRVVEEESVEDTEETPLEKEDENVLDKPNEELV